MKCTIAIPKFEDGAFRKYMQSKYTASLRRAGAKAVWIKTDDLDKAIEMMLQCDGLLLSGGEDVDPAYYGQTVTDKCGKIVPERDHAEMKVLEAFLATGKPVLGICRGEQLLNVAFGGSLYQHIDGHKQDEPGAQNLRPAKVVDGTLLSRIAGKSEIFTNTFHHQAVKDVAPGFIASAYAEDGTVEAIEPADALDSERFILAVQWHPEMFFGTDETASKIFKTFVDACK